ncbi:Sec-independent protein translocase protein TatB [Limibacillus sp. MBR-115]|jgi:sec-independent protein translocase protein TatB|uniref:Sec-independent protein translocase protein TatB n=1 Tax=Limibacillus sp. MBR-115 TaxID=3156465 RepID=UPI003391F45C
MFDIGWTEMAIIALIALVVIGPKDLPGAMRTVGHWVRKIRTVARDFQSGLDDMIRESELSEARKSIEGASNLNPKKILEDTVDPTGDVAKEARSLQQDAEAMPGDEAKESKVEKAPVYKTTSAAALKSSPKPSSPEAEAPKPADKAAPTSAPEQKSESKQPDKGES